MATDINNLRLLESVVIKKLRAGIRAAVEETERAYKEELSVQEAGPPFKGPHARPFYDYPKRETGQGQENVSSGIRGREGRAGVKDAFRGTGPIPPHTIAGGFHLEWLRRRGWKGIDDAFIEHLPEIRQVTKRAMRK